MEFNELLEDKMLGINTVGRDDSYEDETHHPYEPTEYAVLERIIESGYIKEESHVIDYGSGKGRACIYFSDRTGCKSTGVESSRAFYLDAEENRRGWEYLLEEGREVSFVLCDAREFEVPPDADAMFFFHPFPEKVLGIVIKKIIASYYNNPRDIKLIFYYPSDEYISYLKSLKELKVEKKIDCNDLFEKKSERNVVWVFSVANIYGEIAVCFQK